ncbi:MAG TPA: TipAS antibiotic-recognition domain-containing protein [Actinomycetales bacterium]|nr:TipAS antibiotic-recognition domain-containing protein [Actinomycetales bacterium]
MEWSIQEIARMAGTTSRTLRHYDKQGLVAPSRIGNNGYRYYDEAALVRLQRVLLLRELGLGLSKIAQVLNNERDPTAALTTHLSLLRQEQRRLAKQVAAVASTVNALKEGRPLMANEMFEGFDHTQYREEVEQCWGMEAYATSDKWWREMGDSDRKTWKANLEQLNADWIAAAQAPSIDATSSRAQELARRHIEWLKSVPGTPANNGGDLGAYIKGLAHMYVDDERFATNYGGAAGARFVRDALVHHVQAGESDSR